MSLNICVYRCLCVCVKLCVCVCVCVGVWVCMCVRIPIQEPAVVIFPITGYLSRSPEWCCPPDVNMTNELSSLFLHSIPPPHPPAGTKTSPPSLPPPASTQGSPRLSFSNKPKWTILAHKSWHSTTLEKMMPLLRGEPSLPFHPPHTLPQQHNGRAGQWAGGTPNRPIGRLAAVAPPPMAGRLRQSSIWEEERKRIRVGRGGC